MIIIFLVVFILAFCCCFLFVAYRYKKRDDENKPFMSLQLKTASSYGVSVDDKGHVEMADMPLKLNATVGTSSLSGGEGDEGVLAGTSAPK